MEQRRNKMNNETKSRTDAMKILLDSFYRVFTEYLNCSDVEKLDSYEYSISLLLDEIAKLQRKIIKQNSKKRGTKK
jgi:hypothetical protein